MTHDTLALLRDVLLRHLIAARLPNWPGSDGLTVDEVLDCYPQAVAAGVVPDWRELLAVHPDLDSALHDFLAKPDRWEFAIAKRHQHASKKSLRGSRVDSALRDSSYDQASPGVRSLHRPQ